MSITVVAHFPSLEESVVAVSMLHAADIPAFALDHVWGTSFWHYARVLKGFRVAVPTSLADEAKAALAIAEPPARIEAWRGLHPISTSVGFLCGLLSGAGAPIAGLMFHTRRDARRAALIERDSIDG